MYLGVSQAKRMISLFLFDDIRNEFEKKRRIIVYGLVTRYGPRNQLPAQGVNQSPFLVNRLSVRLMLAPKGAFEIYFQGTVNCRI